MTTPRRVTIMGSTGSIGCSALSVIDHANSGTDLHFEIDALVAGSDVEALADQALKHRPSLAVIADESKLEALRERLRGSNIGCAAGQTAVLEAAARPCDRVLGAIVGAAGLPSTLAAVHAGNSVALANKESIVSGGPMLLKAAAERNVPILPVDSEHNAIFQVFLDRKSVESLTITASGGPFRELTLEAMRHVSPEQARAHPVWDMGIKNSIDSASLMNKALEFIEAAYLFDMPEDRIDVLVHPQSIVHGMAHYKDRSVLAQLGVPDMRTPIANALCWPDRVETPVERLNLAEIGALTFEAVDSRRFPAIDLARAAIRAGKGAPTALNSANESAVTAFIGGMCGFLDISSIVEGTLDWYVGSAFALGEPMSLEELSVIDREARRKAGELVNACAASNGVAS
ncbi:MAG: 1-deoxy-D-xylulose-5-phosphate reductoisomerase [Pseudomonadota bacterium]